VEQAAERMLFDVLPGLPIVVETQPTLRSRDGGIRPLRPFHAQIGFPGRFIDGLDDPRDPALIDHRATSPWTSTPWTDEATKERASSSRSSAVGFLSRLLRAVPVPASAPL